MIESTSTGKRPWAEMQRGDFDTSEPLVLFSAPGTRASRKRAQETAGEPDLFSEPDDSE